MPLLRSVESLRITPGPAEVGGGNNNQRSRVVVGGERKANAALAFENKVTGYNFFFSICIGLINERLVEPDLAALYRDDQITAWIDVWHEMVVGHCRDVKHDCVWVRGRASARVQRKHQFVSGQEEIVARSAREKSDPRVRLSQNALEAQWKLAIPFKYLRSNWLLKPSSSSGALHSQLTPCIGRLLGQIHGTQRNLRMQKV